MKKYLNILGSIGISSILMFGCQDSVETPEVNFTATPTTLSVGETVTFKMGYGASSYALFTGDEGHLYEKSAFVKVGDDINDTVYREPDPSIQRFEVDFADPDVVITDVVETPNIDDKLQIVGIEDGALKLTTSTEGWGNNLVIKPNVGLGSEATALNMRVRFATPDPSKQVRFTTTIVVDGIESSSDWSNGRIYPTFAADGSYADISIELAGVIDSWKKNSGGVYGALEKIIIVIGGGPTANRYVGDIFLESISLGINGYFEFDKGVGLQQTEYKTDLEYEYKYSQPGTYEAVMLATNVGGKEYEGDGYKSGRGDEIIVDEYGIAHQIKRLTITVTE